MGLTCYPHDTFFPFKMKCNENLANARPTLKAPGVMKEMLLWSRERDLSEGRVPKARSDRNFSRFFSRLMAEASQGNSLGNSAMLVRSHSTLQLFSCVQEQDGGQARTQAQRANTAWGSRHSTDTGGGAAHGRGRDGGRVKAERSITWQTCTSGRNDNL